MDEVHDTGAEVSYIESGIGWCNLRILIAIAELSEVDSIDVCAETFHFSPADYYKIIHVVPLNAGVAERCLPTPLVDEIRHDSFLCAKSMVRKAALRLRDRFHNMHVEEEVCEGSPSREIVKVAQQWQADLVIVGRHRVQRTGQILAGSVSQAVMTGAPCAVMTFHNLQEADLSQQRTSACGSAT